MDQTYTPPQLWLRDPYEYLTTVLDTPWSTIRTVWSDTFLLDTGLSPRRFLNYTIPDRNWEALALESDYAYFFVGKDKSVMQKWRRWKYGQSINELMKLFSSGNRFLVELPSANVSAKERDEFYKTYEIIRRSCPQGRPHIYNSVGYAKGIGLQPRSADFDLSHLPDRSCLQLPNGRLVRERELQEADYLTHKYWVRLLGYKSLEDIKTYQDMILFEMRSMIWASANWEKINATKIEEIPRVKSPTRYSDETFEKSYAERLAEMSESDADYVPRETTQGLYSWGRRKALPTDRIACDTCSLADVCKAFRQGSVCAVPKTEGDSLRKRFGTRNSGAIIGGLQELMQINADRIQTAVRSEDIEEKGLDPELSKLIEKTIDQGEKVAKLIDPRLRPGPASQVLINNQNSSSQPQLASASPQQLTATVVRELEAQGMKREDITPEIINNHIKVLSNMSPAGDFNDDDEGDIVDAEIEE